jgi:hypothetical protein
MHLDREVPVLVDAGRLLPLLPLLLLLLLLLLVVPPLLVYPPDRRGDMALAGPLPLPGPRLGIGAI